MDGKGPCTVLAAVGSEMKLNFIVAVLARYEI